MRVGTSHGPKKRGNPILFTPQSSSPKDKTIINIHAHKNDSSSSSSDDDDSPRYSSKKKVGGGSMTSSRHQSSGGGGEGGMMMTASAAAIRGENQSPQKKKSNLWKRAFIGVVFLMALTALILAIVYMKRRHDYTEDISSISSRVFVLDSSSGDVNLGLNDIHAFFGFANFTCEPSGEIQFIQTTMSGNLIGVDEAWYKIMLRSTIENTDPDIFSLNNDGFTVSLSEPGSYHISAFSTVIFPLGYNSSITTCIFVDVNNTGLGNVLKRVAFDCDNPDFLGDSVYGPLILVSTTDTLSIFEPVNIVIRLIIISDIETQAGITSTRLKLTKI